MPSQWYTIVVDSADPAAQARFWGEVLGYPIIYEAPDEDIVREHSRMLGEHKIEALHEIAGDVTPADFPG